MTSFESLQRPLVVHIPEAYRSSSLDSSLNASPTTGILDPRPTTASSLPAMSASLTVKFAPLPKLGPRKRKSAMPLGVASRAQLMRRRRGYDGNGDSPPGYPSPTPMWVDNEGSPRRAHTIATSHIDANDEEDFEDPFLSLGKMVKGASRSIWRRVSQKGRQGSENGERVQRSVGSESPGRVSDSNIELPPSSAAGEQRHVLATISGQNTVDNTVQMKEEGGVCEEEVEEGFPLNVGQTETMVEGHSKYSWASKVEIVPPPATGGKRKDRGR